MAGDKFTFKVPRLLTKVSAYDALWMNMEVADMTRLREM
jgi:hypothetical protein